MDHSGIVSVVRDALADALALLLPVQCAGCAEPDAELCPTCAAALRPHVRARELDGVAVRTGLEFDGVPARVIRALKEDGRVGLARDLAPALAAAVAATPGAQDAVLIPVPTSRASFRRRGFHVAELVARRARLPVRRGLRLVRRVGDQRGLDVDARRRNVAGALAADEASGPVLVLDDVLTTGATLTEAIRALRAGGAEIVGAVAIAATPRRLLTPGGGHRGFTGDSTPGPEIAWGDKATQVRP